MARHFVKSIPVPSTVSAGAAVEVAGLSEMVVQFVLGGGTITSVLQGSLDGTNWFNITGGSFSASGGVSLSSQAWKYLRFNTTASTAGSGSANVGGVDMLLPGGTY